MVNYQQKREFDATHQLLIINSTLLLAADDEDFLASISLCSQDPLDLYMLQIVADKGIAIGATVTAALTTSIRHHLTVQQYVSATDMPLIQLLDSSEDGVWLSDSSNGQTLNLLNMDQADSHSAVAIKLFKYAPDQKNQLYSFVLVIWPSEHQHTAAERYIYAVASHVASAVLASRQNVTLKLLKINAALLIAPNEQSILDNLATCTDPVADVHLLCVDKDTSGVPIGASLIASRFYHTAIENISACRAFSRAEMPLLTPLSNIQEPVWFTANLSEEITGSPLPRSFGDVQSLAAMKLFDVNGTRQWYGFLLFIWHVPHTLTNDERYILSALSQPLSGLVTSHRRHAEALSNLTKLKELDKLKNDFIYSMSHELRTPLNGIISVADLILSGIEGEISPEIERGLRIILSSGEHLLTLVTEILDFAKIESGSVKLCIEPFSIANVIEEAITTTNLNTLSVRVSSEPELPLVRADRTRIRQILVNLLSNAVKFADKGLIDITTHRDGASIIVSVRDEGIGIAEAHQQVIFEPFRQLDDGLTRKHGGTGLGLAICKRLVELHSGRIWLRSEPGKGSTFYFSIPAGIQP